MIITMMIIMVMTKTMFIVQADEDDAKSALSFMTRVIFGMMMMTAMMAMTVKEMIGEKLLFTNHILHRTALPKIGCINPELR